ncbi:MAG: stage II sporulation protein M [Candidatus Woesearchaeota archaeon]
MVLDELFNALKVKHRPYMAFFLAFIFTFIAFFVAFIFFRDDMSVALIFLTTLLLVPTIITLIRLEEAVERKEGLKHFVRNHREIFEAYLFAFLGVFAAYLVLGFGSYDNPVLYDSMFNFQTKYLNFQQGVTEDMITSFVKGFEVNTFSSLFGLFSHDLLVLVLCFLLSFFYGASAIFLMMLNASVFANFVIFVSKTVAENLMQGVQVLGFFLIHMIPEVSGYLLAAIAGGVVSKAVFEEKKGSQAFKNVFKDATVLILIAVELVFVATVLEVFVTAPLFQAFF